MPYSNEPTLATTSDTKRTARILGETVPMVASVYAYLRKSGVHTPYFSITYWAHRAGFESHRSQGGAGHETIRELFGNRFDDLIALHLATEDGTPMHANANGAYYLRGYFGGMGAQFHGGNNEQHFPLDPADIDPAKPWRTTEYRKPTRLECLAIFAKLWRIDMNEAKEIARDCRAHGGGERFVQRLDDHRATMQARWKRQAQAAIHNHNLQTYESP